MGEAASTAVLTVEDIGEKFPESKSELKFLVPLQDTTIKIGDKHRFSVQGEETFQLREAVGKNSFWKKKCSAQLEIFPLRQKPQTRSLL